MEIMTTRCYNAAKTYLNAALNQETIQTNLEKIKNVSQKMINRPNDFFKSIDPKLAGKIVLVLSTSAAFALFPKVMASLFLLSNLPKIFERKTENTEESIQPNGEETLSLNQKIHQKAIDFLKTIKPKPAVTTFMTTSFIALFPKTTAFLALSPLLKIFNPTKKEEWIELKEMPPTY